MDDTLDEEDLLVTFMGLEVQNSQYVAAAHEKGRTTDGRKKRRVVKAPCRATSLLILRCQEVAPGSAIFLWFRESF